MKNNSRSWSDAELRLCKRLHTELGYSYEQIAAYMPGKTRNAVAGTCNRQVWRKGKTHPAFKPEPKPEIIKFPPFKAPVPIEVKEVDKPEWQCHTPGCTKTRARPYLHCRECKAAKMQTAR